MVCLVVLLDLFCFQAKQPKERVGPFTVTPSDGFDFGVTAGPSAPVVIGNTAPSFESVVISPDPAFASDTSDGKQLWI